MKKLFLIIPILAVGIACVFLFRSIDGGKKQTVYIALAGPMSGIGKEDGEAMRRGAEMARETIRKRGGTLQDKVIELLPYNDKNKRTAVKIASQISDEGKALLVIGHYSSEGSAAAGTIYKKNGIPAIMASASVSASADDAVLDDNAWYFRIMPDSNFMREFLAYSVKNLLDIDEVSIIYDQTEYDKSAQKALEDQLGQKQINIAHKWFFTSSEEATDRELNNIRGELRAAEKTGMLLFATGMEEAVRLIASFRYPGTDYLVLGPNTFSSPSFISRFAGYEKERKEPGYYTHGILAVSPFISYLADKPEATAFRQNFVRRYGEEPSWVAANYYDAMLVALNALERAEIQGNDIREDRGRIRKALKRLNEPDVAVQGATGNIFFNKKGNFIRPMSLGFWRNHQFIPFYVQYQAAKMTDKKTENAKSVFLSTEDESDTGKERIKISGQSMVPLKVIYTGVDVKSIHRIDTEQGTFTAEFYLWFSFKGSFDDTSIKFSNAVSPVKLGKPITAKTDGQIKVRLYKVIADFKTKYDLSHYPLDRQALGINFHHLRAERNEIIYIQDIAAISSVEKRGELHREKIGEWEVLNTSFFQDRMTEVGSDKTTRSYSMMHVDVNIQRTGHLFLLGRTALPIIIIIFLLYLVFFIPVEQVRVQLKVCALVVSLTIGLRFIYGYLFPGLEVIRYMFQILYAQGVFSLLVLLTAHAAHAHTSYKTRRWLYYFTLVCYPAVAVGGILLFCYLHGPLLIA